MSLIACGSIHQGHKRFILVITPGVKISIKPFFMMIIFFSSELLGKNVFIRSKLPIAAPWSREKREEFVKPTCFMSKATSIPQVYHPQYASPVEALNLIVESKSLPIELK